MAEPSHADLFKLAAPTLSESVSKRRERLLTQQKLRRQTSADDHREGIHNLLNQLTQNSPTASSRRQKRTPSNTKYKNTLQLSEWLSERPDDLDNWIMVGCPKGVRCLVVATSGKTLVFGKNGGFIWKLRSQLPGDAGNQQDATILDCVFDKGTGEYWVLDALAYGKLDFINCNVSFRFFWIRSRIESGELIEGTDAEQEAVFRMVRTVDCSDGEAMHAMLGTFPMYSGNVPEVDGLLFYHKESSYVHGKTPLVGWLLPFMVGEVLGLDVVHPSWLALRPDGYADAATFMAQFDAALKRRSRGRRLPDMEVEVAEDDDKEIEESEMIAEQYSGRTGECFDDGYYNVVK